MSDRASLGWQTVGLLGCGITVSLGLELVVAGTPAIAQLIPDNTLEAESSRVTPEQIGGLPSDRIEGGAIRGSSLFHSFQEFNVEEGRGVYFANPAGVETILSRVTGTNRSDIYGRLGVLGNADLFLLNPNGMVFGPNATLDIRGSFVATTATSFVFPDGSELSAANPQEAPLLAVNVPIGLQYGSNVGALRVQGATLEMPSGQTLALVGGKVTVNSGRLLAPGGRVELAGVAANGTVNLATGLAASGSPLLLSFPAATRRSDITITDGSRVNVRSGGGGDIAINARNLSILGESIIQAGIRTGMGSADAQAGDIEINTTQATNLNFSYVISTVEEDAIGDGGGIEIQTGLLSLTNGAQLTASTFGRGDAGSIMVRDAGGVRLNNGAAILSTVEEDAIGDGGRINIQTGLLSLTNGAQLQAPTFGRGDAGSIVVRATDEVRLDGTSADGQFLSAIVSTVGEDAIGDGGRIDIQTDSLSLANGAQLAARTLGRGDAGSIMVRDADEVRLDGIGAVMISNVEVGAVGDGGRIGIQTGLLSLTNGAQLQTSTRGRGDAGSIVVRDADEVRLDGTSVDGQFPSVMFNNVEVGAVGDGGRIDIQTGLLSLTSGAQLATSTFGRGDAGSIVVRDADEIKLDGTSADGRLFSTMFSDVGVGAIGDGGRIDIQTDSLSLTNGAQLTASTLGRGDAGSIVVRDADEVRLNNRAAILSTVGEDVIGDGGRIDIQTGLLSLTNGAQLATSTFGRGDAGNIVVLAANEVRLDGTSADGQFLSAIVSTVGEGAIGDGGRIDIQTGLLSLTNGAQLAASTFGRGDAGSIIIRDTDEVRLNGTGAAMISAVEEGAVGDGGRIEIQTDSLLLSNGAQLAASTNGTGGAGSIVVLAANEVRLNNRAAMFSAVEEGAIGDGGDIEIDTGSLFLTNGAQLLAPTSGQGDAGNIVVLAANEVRLDGTSADGQFLSAMFSDVEVGAIGDGGDIEIDTDRLSISNGAALSVSSADRRGQAGNIRIRADRVHLDLGGLFAETRARSDTTGAEITLSGLDLLLLENGSLISARAFDRANGGNINIESTFIVATPGDNDITASAERGQGGRIDITTQSLLGLQERRAIPGNGTNDIDASSEFGLSGNVTINRPGVDPSRGIIQLPAVPLDATNQIAQRCSPGSQGGTNGEFVVTGRGGRPTTPTDILDANRVLDDLGDASFPSDTPSEPVVNSSRAVATPSLTEIVEAQGWITDADGNVVLVADAATTTPHDEWEAPLTCAAATPSSS